MHLCSTPVFDSSPEITSEPGILHKSFIPHEPSLSAPMVNRPRISIGSVTFAPDRFVVVAGPCAVESPEQIRAAADFVSREHVAILRGGAFKARTSPYAFQGLGLEGLRLLAEEARRIGVPVVSEVLSQRDIEPMLPFVDAFQVGSRNMDNTALLKELSEIRTPIILKRGFAATIKEWILAAEYLLLGGNDQVVLCERGIRTFSDTTRFTLDLAGAVHARRESGLPVLVDPSHATGDPSLILPMALATLGAGLDGIMVETHPDPATALSDGHQALAPDQFHDLMKQLRIIAPVLDRGL